LHHDRRVGILMAGVPLLLARGETRDSRGLINPA